MTDREHPLTALRSDLEIVSVLGDVQIDGLGGLRTLPAAAFALDGGDADMKAQRGELITAIRGGKHAELSVNAITWRQRPTPNRRYLRLATDKLADRAGSWKGKPLLIDHATYTVKSAMGTILSSKLLEESAKVVALEQSLHVVKPDAVIGFLDGTMRTFSIGWYALGPVMCSVHGLDVTGPESCYCWPGDAVMVDGEKKIVQYEFSDYEGKETSIVVSPAVRDTSVEGIRAALSAELHLHPARPRPSKENKSMAFTKLAAALKLAALSESDEDAAVGAVTALGTRAVTAELDLRSAQAENARLTAENARLTKEVEAAGAAALDGLIEGAYKSGKLAYGKDAAGANTPDPMESLLRDFGQLKGRKELEAKLAAMSARVPVGVPPVSTTTTEAPKPTTLHAVPSDAEIRETATQLGVSENTMRGRLGLAPIGGAA